MPHPWRRHRETAEHRGASKIPPGIEIRNGDALDVLRSMPDRSVQCCVVSVPYFWCRDFGTAEWVGGDPGCDHVAHKTATFKTWRYRIAHNHFHKAGCPCGAVRIDRQIGVEASLEEYVEKLVAVFREVRRVLKDDGTLFLNIGDSYSEGTIGRRDTMASDGLFGGQMMLGTVLRRDPRLKQKQLLGIPWRVAFALQDDGWYLRQDVIWSKPNPMVESVRDRFTKAHEYVFLLTKSPRYRFNQIKEPAVTPAGGRIAKGSVSRKSVKGVNARPTHYWVSTGFRNMRSVWVVATQPYKGAHYAVMPQELAEICIRAGSNVGDVILDPFGGTATTALVASRLGRKAICIELNPGYVAQAKARLRSLTS